MFKIMELATNKAFETTYYNVMGMTPDAAIQFNPQSNLLKKVREFFNKNKIIRTFLEGMDKKDERVFASEVKA
jgi:hypothetical protein